MFHGVIILFILWINNSESLQPHSPPHLQLERETGFVPLSFDRKDHHDTLYQPARCYRGQGIHRPGRYSLYPRGKLVWLDAGGNTESSCLDCFAKKDNLRLVVMNGESSEKRGRFSTYLLIFANWLTQHSLQFLRRDTPWVAEINLMMFAALYKSILGDEIAVHLCQNGSLIIV